MILLGLSRAGKTTVGQRLAERLGCSFYDTDELIRIRTGLTPRELCRQAGLSALHTAEVAALRECCGLAIVPSRPFSAVIAAGGGICDNSEASAVIAAIPLRVFLYAEEAVLFERLTHDAQRIGYYPAFLRFLPVTRQAEAQRLFSELYLRRTERYRRSCNLIIDTSGLDCPAIVQKIAEQR